jgi:hypothetical protein
VRKPARAQEATLVLRENFVGRVIRLGDISADLNFARLTREYWKFLGFNPQWAWHSQNGWNVT